MSCLRMAVTLRTTKSWQMKATALWDKQAPRRLIWHRRLKKEQAAKLALPSI